MRLRQMPIIGGVFLAAILLGMSSSFVLHIFFFDAARAQSDGVCDATCRRTWCGDGVVQDNPSNGDGIVEECEGDTCAGGKACVGCRCIDIICCGNGIIEASEGCDDGKRCTTNGDPCVDASDCPGGSCIGVSGDGCATGATGCTPCTPAAEICTDGIDNSCDGLIDSADSGCPEDTICGTGKTCQGGFCLAVDTTPPAPSGFNPANNATITDATQTITFTTDENATCKVSLTDQAYADMSTACTGGGTTSQSCTTPDLGANGSKNVYIACTDGTNADTIATNENLTYTLSIVVSPEICDDGIENNVPSDGLIDCADTAECPAGTTCGLYGNQCSGWGTCECPYYESWEWTCNDGLDNDCDGLPDCDDPNCDYQYCDQYWSNTCSGGVCGGGGGGSSSSF